MSSPGKDVMASVEGVNQGQLSISDTQGRDACHLKRQCETSLQSYFNAKKVRG